MEALKEFRITLPHEPGQLARVGEALGGREINIMTVAAFGSAESNVALVTDNEDETAKVLDELGLAYETVDLLTVSLPHQPGALGVFTMNRMSVNGLVLLIILCMCACSGRNDEITSHAFRVFTENGVMIAETIGGPKYSEELFEYEYLLTLKEDERVESLLFNPAGLDMDEMGCFYVNDTGNTRIAVFDNEGRYSHSIGREGQGPGEFRMGFIQSVRDGVVTVLDMFQQRITRFNYDGTLIEAIGLQGGLTSSLSISGYYFLPLDHRLIIVMEADLANALQVEDMAIRATVTNAGGDTLWTRRTPDVKVINQAMIKLGDQVRPFPVPIPFGPQPSMSFHPDYGIAVNAGLAPELEFWNLDGETRMHVKIDMVPEIPTEEERQYIIRSYKESQEDAPEFMKSVYDSQIENLHMPEAKASWTDIYIDDSGFTWLMQPVPAVLMAADDTTKSFRIISPEGEYMGNTTRPVGGSQNIAHGMMLLQTTDPETGEYLLMVYRIKPAVEGLKYP